MKPRTPDRPDDPGSEGPGAGPEEAEGALETSPELEEAMREAAESVAARQAARRTGDEAGAGREPHADETAGELRQELDQLKDRYLRTAADLENFRRRALKDKEEAHQFGHQNLVKDLLPTVDNLERAIDHARRSGEGGLAGLLEGVELALRELLAALAKHGVTPIEAQDQPFDPSLHEAMAQGPDASKPATTVVEVFQRGYQLRGRLIRPARVVVSKPPPGAEQGARGEQEG